MKVSPHGLRLIENREGIRLKAYRDSKGLPTIGVGHLIVPGDGFSINSRITQEQCDALFAQDVAKYENAVNSLNVPLSQNQFDALVSFCLNIGIGGFKGSSVARRLKAKDYNGAGHAMMSWVKPPEITGRRQTEQNQFFTPDPKPAATNASPQPTDAQNTLDSNSITTASDPTVNAADNSSSQGILDNSPKPDVPVVQNADTIVNTGDTAPPTSAPQDITMNAPVPMGSVQGAGRVTILGIAVPAFIVAFAKMVGQWFEDGKLDVQKAFDTVVQLIQQNFKYILILAGLVVGLIIVKKVLKELVFLATVVSHMVPNFNNVTVVAPEPVVAPKKWYQVWK